MTEKPLQVDFDVGCLENELEFIGPESQIALTVAPQKPSRTHSEELQPLSADHSGYPVSGDGRAMYF